MCLDSPMKAIFQAILIGAVVVAAGCVHTVSDQTKAGVPFIKDKVFGRYERPVPEVFASAKTVIKEMGVLVNESTLYEQTNTVKTVEGKVNQRSVWVRVEELNPALTEVTVQTRTSGGGSDLNLAHEIEKRIALGLK